MTGPIKATLLATVLIVGGAGQGAAQRMMCDRNLSTLEADQGALAVTAREATDLMRLIKATVDDVEEATLSSDACPADYPESLASVRNRIGAVPTADLLAKSRADLLCSQEFVGRVTGDIAKAQAEGNSTMVVRLNAISQRILRLDAAATQSAIEIQYLDFWGNRLLAAMTSVEEHCGDKDSIYD